jgi:iron complex outermembrane receptor protein
MRYISACLLAGAAFTWPLAVAAKDGSAAPAQLVVEDDQTVAAEDVVVIGGGETRQVQRLGAADIAVLTPGTSPLRAIQKLPGVNVQNADAFGAYEWSQRVSIRGFNQNQLGFTLDGIPLGDGSYGNTNGLHISRAITSENIGRVQVSQGAGSIGTQATNNLGGTIEFVSSDPRSAYGFQLNGTYGDANTVRAYGRLDTGELGAGGPSAYVSYTYFDTDKYKGFGSQRQHQVNAKVVAPLIPDLKLIGTFDFSDRRENDYQDMSLDMIRRLGYGWDNISNDFVLATRVADVGANTGYTGATRFNPAAGTSYPAPFANADDAYFDAAGLRKDYLASIGLVSDAGPITSMVKVYYHGNQGQGIWYTPYVPSPSTVPISIRTTEYLIKRKGLFASVGADAGVFGAITVGGWYEKNDFRQARRFYGLTNRLRPSRDSLDFQTGAFATQWDFDYVTQTLQYHVQDKLTFGDLTVNLGWKGFDVDLTATPITAGGLARGRIDTTDWFQPHAGFSYRVTPDLEAFGGFTQVTRAFTASATGGPFATTQAGFNGLGALKPETSDTVELGTRVRSGVFTGSLAGYLVDFQNRLIAFANGAGIIGNPAILQNVGSVRSLGLEATGQVRLPMGFGAFASYAYNDSTYRNDVRNAAGTLLAATRGKTVVDAPRHIAAAEVTYDSDILFGRIGANYMSKRYFTYENDQSVPGRVLFEATIGTRLELDGRKFELQLNGVNLFDKDYVATIGSNGFGNRGDNQTLLIGAPRQVFVTLKAGL